MEAGKESCVPGNLDDRFWPGKGSGKDQSSRPHEESGREEEGSV